MFNLKIFTICSFLITASHSIGLRGENTRTLQTNQLGNLPFNRTDAEQIASQISGIAEGASEFVGKTNVTEIAGHATGVVDIATGMADNLGGEVADIATGVADNLGGEVVDSIVGNATAAAENAQQLVGEATDTLVTGLTQQAEAAGVDTEQVITDIESRVTCRVNCATSCEEAHKGQGAQAYRQCYFPCRDTC